MLTASRGVAVTSTVLVPHATHSVADVRQAALRDLRGNGCPAELVEDAVLVLSEIVSNALKHARPLESGKVRVEWTVEPRAIRLAVTDGGSSTRPRMSPPSRSATGGRGLGIVNDLAGDWGVTED
ncbi:MAG: ATP-binding protein, partial [Actinomycetota bacterium]|nr:ATP-binding protein [Actinomycetota bacterium]